MEKPLLHSLVNAGLFHFTGWEGGVKIVMLVWESNMGSVSVKSSEPWHFVRILCYHAQPEELKSASKTNAVKLLPPAVVIQGGSLH